MSVLFKTTAKKNPRDLTAKPKYYATAIQRDVTTIDELSQIISSNSTMSRADVYGVVIELLERINFELKEGRSVNLDKLGRFRLALRSEGADKPEEVTSRQIKSAKIIFSPAKEMREMLNTLKYVKST